MGTLIYQANATVSPASALYVKLGGFRLAFVFLDLMDKMHFYYGGVIRALHETVR